MKNERVNRIGLIKLNYQGCPMKIIEYNDANNIIVEFQDEYNAKIHSAYREFERGKIKNPYYPEVYNVGIVGNKYMVRSKHDRAIKEYDSWTNMLRRCFSKKLKEKQPTYENISCCDEWLLYENFYEWLHGQPNYAKWKSGYRWGVDKDILVKGNNIYSPETCCLVPQNINCLFTKSNASRGDLPIGVNRHGNKYRASFGILNKTINLTVRNTIEEAFQDYKTYKESHIKQVAKEEYSKGNITKQCYDAMMKYEVEITD